MKKIIGIIVAITALELGIIGVGTSQAHADTTTTKVCSDARKGKVCANVVKYGPTSRITKEAWRLATPDHLPMDEATKVTYRGWASKDLTNGKDRWAVKSKIKAKRWHLFTVRVLPACANEDGPGPCYWNAATQGNGEGRSFVIKADGTIVYLP